MSTNESIRFSFAHIGGLIDTAIGQCQQTDTVLYHVKIIIFKYCMQVLYTGWIYTANISSGK